MDKGKDYFNQQLSFYDPDLTICCGTGWFYHEFVFGVKEWKISQRGIEYFERKRGKFVLSYSHPEARVSPNLLYYGLVDAIREILKVRVFC
ncbi:hypothetical protein [Kiloniella spongiae]|uniref:hypothetical protein n=1 Tax=Kiloniella spongiae TaxID=1489064 RepID=UPI00069BC4C9|nr:hypothetical protein [Kiloniella spongiae]